jgi:hypothetical protein
MELGLTLARAFHYALEHVLEPMEELPPLCFVSDGCKQDALTQRVSLDGTSSLRTRRGSKILPGEPWHSAIVGPKSGLPSHVGTAKSGKIFAIDLSPSKATSNYLSPG